jgi:hypothetical protein
MPLSPNLCGYASLREIFFVSARLLQLGQHLLALLLDL